MNNYDSNGKKDQRQESNECLVYTNRMIDIYPVFSSKDGGRGYVYLLRAKNGLVKIGQTVNLPIRLQRHRRKYYGEWAFDVIAIIYSSNCEHLEKHLHRQYRTKHVANKHIPYRGDWFSLDTDDVAAISMLGGER